MEVTTDHRELAKFAGLTLFIFTIMGLGLGLAGNLTANTIEESMSSNTQESETSSSLLLGLVTLQTAYTIFLIGPVVACFTGLLNGVLSNNHRTATVGTGIGAFLGFYLLVLLGVYITTLAIETGSGGGSGSPIEAGNAFISAGIPTALVAVAMSYTGGKLTA